MSRQVQITIPEKCHEDWDQMTPADKGRFCASCQKQVIDFTNMSDSQLAAFFKRPLKEELVCGRFYNDQLNRDIEIPKKRIPWVKYFFQFALPALFVSMRATAQGGVKVKKKDIPVLEEVVLLSKRTPGPITNIQQTLDQDISAMIEAKVSGPVIVQQAAANVPLAARLVPQLIKYFGEIKGKVVDNKGTPVAGATVVIKGTNKGAMTNVSGEFTIIPEEKWQSKILMASSVGFMTSELRVTNDMLSSNLIIQVPLEPALTGEVLIVRKKPKKQSKTIPVLTQKLMDTAYKFFKIFPNPVSSGASVHIEWKQTEEGYYTFELVDLSGRKVYSKEIWIDSEARLLNLELPSVASGSYFLQATNKNSGKRFTEKIVIE